jgi:hypothetical protein
VKAMVSEVSLKSILLDVLFRLEHLIHEPHVEHCDNGSKNEHVFLFHGISAFCVEVDEQEEQA